ncbi:MAG: hypothetical protein QG656_1670 [Candidatus Hydrogenedentes bacterium]|nr:hypothetical protein [Candidatus Hydrogenedentota bacterium]
MNHRRLDRHTSGSSDANLVLSCFLLFMGVCLCGGAQETGDKIDLAMGGTGGVYFLVEPGEFTVDIEKRDRHVRDVRTDLRAILVGPDRQPIGEVTIADDGQARGSGTGPAQRAHLSALVERTGVYALNVTVSNDRYGDEILWGFRTNCPRYLIETARGHRDERRQEPIVLMNPDAPGDICFLPRDGAFGVEVSGLPEDVKSLPVYDGSGALVETLQADAEGRAAHTFPAGAGRGSTPWRLHLPKQQAVVQIDGVTRWDNDDPYTNLPLWTNAPAAFFSFHAYRWLLTPYSQTVYGQPGESREVVFQVHNNADGPRNVVLSAEFSGAPWPVQLSTERVTLKPKESAEVCVRCDEPAEGETRVCYLRAAPEEETGFSTYSTLRAIGGTAPAAQPLSMPLVLKPYCHENEQFGYLPEYPLDGEMYFDLANRPWVSTGDGIGTLRDGQWVTTDFGAAKPFRAQTKVAFDRDNGLYLIGSSDGLAVLLCSKDAGQTFTAYPMGKPGGLDIEQFSGHNVPDGPPPILRSIQTAADPKRIWRRICDLELFLPKAVDGGIVIGDPILVSRQALGVGSHSGLANAVVSRGSKVHVVWAEATDPEEKVPGVPTYVADYDRETGTMGKPVLVGYGAPANDVHNRPSITMDSQGYLHVLTGTHGKPFHYARSLSPNDAYAGWTEAEPVGEGLPQTYIGLVCGSDDTLHLVYRLWRNDLDRFPSGALFATLAYQRKRPGEAWESPRILIVPSFSEYSIFYHRLTIDRKGRLCLSYDYWSTYWFYRTDHFGNRRAVMTSSDAGETWKLLETRDLQ